MPATITEVLDARASHHPERVIYRFLREGEQETDRLDFAQLVERARAIGAELSAGGVSGERAILVYKPGLEFLAAFFGCLFAGVIAVPVSMPNRKRGLDIVRRITTDCDARWVLSTGDVLEQLRGAAATWGIGHHLSFLDTGAVALERPTAWRGGRTNRVALLQYTSGSTGAPRGVVVTHDNLMDNLRQVELTLASHEQARYVSWLPVFHDMGLGMALQAVWGAVECILMPPRAFLQEPRRWLETISRYQATGSGGPDSAFDLCVRRVGPDQRAALDLSCWKVAYNGSEPIRAATIERFVAAFGECGFRRAAFHPMYGLAEATVFVTSENPDEPPVTRAFSTEALEHGLARPVAPAASARVLVSCGHPWLGTEVSIVDPHTLERCAPERVGEIWVRGASVAAGYFRNEEETSRVFGAFTRDGTGPFLRTGDLGFLHEGRLFVTGRARDLLLLDGRQLYPQDVELTASECHPALVPGGCSAFSVEGEEGEAGLVIAQEVSRAALRALDVAEVTRAIRAAVSERHGLEIRALVLLRPATLLRTTSGKVRRQACRTAFLEESLPALARWSATKPTSANEPASGEREAAAARADRMIEFLRGRAPDFIARAAHRGRAGLPMPHSFARRGLLGLQLPASQGGIGLGHRDTVRVLEQMAAIDFVAALGVGLHNALGIQPVARHGSVPLQGMLLPGLAQGREIVAFAALDAGGPLGSANDLRLEARAGGFVVSGTLALQGISESASVLSLLASHAEDGAATALIVFSDQKGVRKRPGVRSTSALELCRRTIVFDAVEVGRHHVLGSVGGGTPITREAEMHARLAIAAACIGGMKRCAQVVSRFTPYGGRWNGKLTPNPVLLSRLGSVRARITALDCLVRAIATVLDGGQAVPREAFGACRLLGPDLLSTSVADLLQLGVSGGPAETDWISRLYRDAGLLRTFDGAPEAAAEAMGSSLLSGDSSLRVLVGEILESPSAEALIERAMDSVWRRMARLQGTLARRAQRWAHTRAGELAAWITLLAAVDCAQRSSPSAELNHAQGWALAQLQQALVLARFGTPSETAALDSSELAASFATYSRAIGNLDLDFLDPDRGTPREGINARTGS